MDNIATLRAEVRAAREEGDFASAAAIGQRVWDDAAERDGWDAWNLAYSLRKLDRSAEAMTVLWTALKLISADERAIEAVGGRLASEFGWSAYGSELKSPEHPQPTRIAKTALRVVETWDKYARTAWTTQYCPVPIVVNRAMKLLKEAQAWAYLAEVATATDGDRMPDEVMRPDQTDSTHGDWTRAEAWYTSAAKAFVEEGRHQEVLELVDRALAREAPLGHHCSRWLYFYGAKAAIGNRDGARAVELVGLARTAGVNDWWMGVLEAEADELAGNRDEALVALAATFITADQRHVSPEFLCSALETATRMLGQDHPELAGRCARIHRGIRESRGWKIPHEVEAATGGLSEPEGSLSQLTDEWRRLQRSSQERHTGTVTRILNEGSGFLRGEDGTDRYFSLPRGVLLPTWCAAGQRVTYRPIQKFDRKAGIEKPAADDLEADIDIA